jgi:PAS domain S-box-containing protein
MNFPARFLSAPRFDSDPEKTRHAQLLHIVSLALFFVFVLLIAVNLAFASDSGRVINYVFAASALLQIITQVLIRRGYVRTAGYILLILSWISITWVASLYDGVRSTTLFGYFTIILTAGYIFGWRTVTLFTVWSILAVWALALYEMWGLNAPVLDKPMSIAINLTALFVFSSIQVYFIVNMLKKSLREADRELRERQRIEQELRNEQERLALAFDASKMGTWNWYIEAGTVTWSDQIEALFGMAHGEFDGTYDSYLALIHPEDLPGLQQAIGRALTDPDYHYVVEHRLMWGNGETRWLEGRGKVYRNADGHPIRMAGTVVDITDRKISEAERETLLKELADKNSELEQFIYMVSHDLKAPIITIRGFLGYLEQDAMSGNHTRLQKDMDRIGSAVDKMHRLLNELLELSRVGRMVNASEAIPFNELIAEALEILDGRLQAVAPQLKISNDLPVIYGDRRRLVELIQNLVDNAANFMGSQPQPQIEIGTSGVEDGMPILYVRDNGVGVAREFHERIFGLFNKLDPNVDGTGVGLALIKRIIEVHGGRIWIESEPGAGSTFYFTLPLAAS